MPDNLDGEQEIVVDGERVELDDFTYREHRDLKRAVREVLEEPESDVDLDTLPLTDFLPAVVYIVKRRSDSKYTLDQALDLKPSDNLRPVQNGNGGPPTKAGARKSTRATTS